MRQTHGNVYTRRRVIRFSLLILFLVLAVARWSVGPSPRATLLGRPWSVVHWTDGQTILTDNPDGTMTVWDGPTGTVRATLPDSADEHPHSAIEFFPHSPVVVSMSFDGTVKSWDAVTGRQLALLKGRHADPSVRDGIELAPDGRTVLYRVADDSGPPSAHGAGVRVWDTLTGKERLSLRGLQYLKRCWTFAPDSKMLVFWDANGAATAFDLATGMPTKVPSWYKGPVRSIVRSPDGTKAVIVQVDNSARLWDLAADQELAILQSATNQSVAAAFSPDSHTGLLRRSDGTIELWDTATGAKQMIRKGTPGTVGEFMMFAPDGKSFATSVVLQPTKMVLEVWDLTLGEEQGRLVTAVPMRHGTRAVFSPDGRTLAFLHIDYPGGRGPPPPWVPQQLAALWYDRPPAAKTILLDVSTGEVLADRGGGHAVTFSRDGKTVVQYAGDGVVELWNPPPRSVLPPILTWSSVAVLLIVLGTWWRDRRSCREPTSMHVPSS